MYLCNIYIHMYIYINHSCDQATACIHTMRSSIFMCLYIAVCRCTYTKTRMYIYMSTCVMHKHIYTHIYKYIYICLHIYIYVYIHMYVHIYAYMYTDMIRIYMHIYTYTHIYIYIYIYTHIYIYKYIHLYIHM